MVIGDFITIGDDLVNTQAIAVATGPCVDHEIDQEANWCLTIKFIGGDEITWYFETKEDVDEILRLIPQRGANPVQDT